MQIEKLKFKELPLDNQIKRAISELGFQSPLEVQMATFDKIMAGKDLIVKSQTGSGKTAAFAIPLCERINVELEAPQVLVLAPTRELAIQVKEDFQDIGKYKGIRCCVVFGKQPMDQQRRELKTNPHVIVATPGRLMDHLLNKNVKLGNLITVVIDEADEMLLMGFQEQLEVILKKTPAERETLLFSATMPLEVTFLSQQFMKSPELIEIEAEVPNIEKIDQLYYAVDGLKKVDFMKKMIKHEKPEKCIIFCNTQEQVDSLFEIFRKWEHSTCAVHGGMDQGLRMEKLKAFKKGRYKILIATDVAARGLHVKGLTHVINYGVPFEHENYVHRIGRTGRVEEHGVAITMVIASEMDRFKALQEFLGYEIPCRGGNVERPRRVSTKHRNGKERFKEDKKRGRGVTLQINAGRMNSSLRTSDILNAVRSIRGLDASSIGKIDFKETTSTVVIYDGKEKDVIFAFKNKPIRGKLYRAKQV